MQFIRSANELKMVHNEKYVEYYLKFQMKKKLHQKCHWSLVSLVDYNIRLSCCVPEKKTNLKSASSLIGDKNSTEAFS